MPDAVGVEPRPNLLGDHIDVIILEVLSDARDEGHTDREAEQERYATDKLADRVVVESRGVGIYHVAEDQRVEKREDLVDRRQNQRRGHQNPIVTQVPIKSRHLLNITI